MSENGEARMAWDYAVKFSNDSARHIVHKRSGEAGIGEVASSVAMIVYH
jgi:hypothetical protein